MKLHSDSAIKPGGNAAINDPGAQARNASANVARYKEEIHKRLFDVVDLVRINTLEEAEARRQIRQICQQLIDESSLPISISVREKVIQQIQTQVQKTPFSFLQKAESENLLTFIQDEHPQTIALIVCHLPFHKASEIVVGLQQEKQIEVIKRIANMEQTNPEVIREVEKGLESRLANMLSQSTEKTGGIDAVAEILNLADRTTEKQIMEGLEVEEPELVEQIRRALGRD